MLFLLGFDIGSSSVKASLVDADSGRTVSSAFYPAQEAPIVSVRPGWAEQDPALWWKYLTVAASKVLEGVKGEVAAIGISYQMHGLVCVDKDFRLLRPSIIWCDSRAVSFGDAAFKAIGPEKCLESMLNSPGNFTAAKLAWVKANEPDVYDRIYKAMLPGDYIAARLTGEISTTVEGLSEGILWDFRNKCLAKEVLDVLGIDESLIPSVVPVFGEQGRLGSKAAGELGLKADIPVCYRAGDQPNNALSLNIFEPGEVASTAGTSGVVYGISDRPDYDPLSRVNSFAHVNYTADNQRIGVMLCINGTGILNSWMRRNIIPSGLSYVDMNEAAASVPVGSAGLRVLPFGNGAERVLCNRNPGCSVHRVDFNRHGWRHLVRAGQEGIAFSFKYGMEIMEKMGIRLDRIHAGNANMFLSPVFREALAGVSSAVIELYDTDGAAGAARAAGIGAGIYKDRNEAFASLELISETSPSMQEEYSEAYSSWKECLESGLR